MRNKPYPTYKGFELEHDFFSILSYCRDQYGSRCAISFRRNKSIETKSFEQLLTDSLKLAAYISSLGWKSQNIAIVSPNSYVWIVTFFAIQFCGNVAVPINHTLPAEDLHELLCKANVCAVFTSDKTIIPDDLSVIIDIESVLQSADDMKSDIEISMSEAPSMIFFTSGSTGHNKGVMLSQQNMCFDIYAMSKYCYPHDARIAIATLPFYHTLGLSTFIFYLLNGMETFIERSPKHLLKDLKAISPSVSTWVPAIADGIYNSIIQTIDSPLKKFKYASLKAICYMLLFVGFDVRRSVFRKVHNMLGGNLKFICCGGAYIRESVIKEFRAWGIYIMSGYGITECSPVVSVNRNYYWRDESAGLILPDISVKISSDGEILVKGKNVFSGYYGDKQSTMEVFDSDGWFRTGDIGHLDKDGFLYITGRKKNIIVLSSGENISPEELEEKLCAYFPDIEEVIVFEENGRIIAEVFAGNNACRDDISKGLISFNKTLIAGKRIYEIRFRDKAFPKTTGGKIKRTYNGADENV